MDVIATTAPARIHRHQYLPAVAILSVFGVLAALALYFGHTVPVPATVVPTSAEQTYVNLMYPRGASDAQVKHALSLGHTACATMSAGTGDHAAYRTAVGALMANQVKPDWAELTAHSALVSGLCLQR